MRLYCCNPKCDQTFDHATELAVRYATVAHCPKCGGEGFTTVREQCPHCGAMIPVPFPAPIWGWVIPEQGLH